MKKVGFILALVGLCMASCSTEEKTITLRFDSVPFVLSGPLFSGPNTAQAEITHQLEEKIREAGLDSPEVSKIRLVNATITGDTAIGEVSSFVLQAMTDKTPMTQIAVLNPVESATGSVQLQPASDADMVPLFKEKMFFLILDADLKIDRDPDISFTGDFTFEVVVH